MRQGGNVDGKRLCLLCHVIGRDDLPVEAQHRHILGAVTLSQQDHAPGFCGADLLRQKTGHTARDKDPQRDFRKEKPCVVGHHDKIAVDNPLQPAANSPPMNAAHDHLAVKAKRPGHVLDFFNVRPGLGRGADLAVEFLEIIPRTKCAPGSGQHDDMHGGIGVSLTERLKQIRKQFGVDGVKPVGAVQGDGGDGIAHLIEHGIGHWR